MFPEREGELEKRREREPRRQKWEGNRVRRTKNERERETGQGASGREPVWEASGAAVGKTCGPAWSPGPQLPSTSAQARVEGGSRLTLVVAVAVCWARLWGATVTYSGISQLEIGLGGSIYTMETGQRDKSGLLSFSFLSFFCSFDLFGRARLPPTHHLPGGSFQSCLLIAD